jgi:hypothetical protein
MYFSEELAVNHGNKVLFYLFCKFMPVQRKKKKQQQEFYCDIKSNPQEMSEIKKKKKAYFLYFDAHHTQKT